MTPISTSNYSYVSGCLDEMISSKGHSNNNDDGVADDIMNKLASLQSQVNSLTQELSLRRKEENREAVIIPSPSTITSELTEPSDLGDEADFQSIKTAPSVKSGNHKDDDSLIDEERVAEVGIGGPTTIQFDEKAHDLEETITDQSDAKDHEQFSFEDYTLTRRIPSTVVEEMISPVDVTPMSHSIESEIVAASSSPPPPLPPLPEKNVARKLSEEKAILPPGVKEARRAWIEKGFFDHHQVSRQPEADRVKGPTSPEVVNKDEESTLLPYLSQAQKEGKDVEALLENEAFGKEASDQISSDKGLKDAVKDGFDLDLFSFIGSTKKVEDRQPSSTKEYWGGGPSSYVNTAVVKKRGNEKGNTNKPILGTRDWDATPLSNGLARRRSSAKDDENNNNKMGLQSPGRRRSSAKDDNNNTASPARRGSEIRMIPFSGRRMSEKEEVAMSNRTPQRRPSIKEEELSGRMSRFKDKIPGSWTFKNSPRNPSTDGRMSSADV